MTSIDNHDPGDKRDLGQQPVITESILAEQNVWSEDYRIRSYEIDAKGNLSIITLLHQMQDAAGNHAKSMGVALTDMLARNFTWVLSRLFLKMDHYPGFGDTISIRTWPTGIQKAFALRDFEIVDQNNRRLGSAVSAWLILEAGTMKLQRAGRFIQQLNPYSDCRSIEYVLNKLPAMDQTGVKREFKVEYSDLDMNQHANNVSFVNWIFQGAPEGIQLNKIVSEMEINYMAEAKIGDRLVSGCINEKTKDGAYIHALFNSESDRELARARTVWVKT